MGTSLTIPASQPDQVSWYAKSSSSTTSDTYFVIGDASTSSNQGIAFVYFASSGKIRYYANSSNVVEINYTANTWYHLEMRNINYVAKTYDVWVNGSLVQSNFPFRSSSSTNISTVYLYNFSNATGSYDNIDIGGSPLTFNTSFSEPLCTGDTNGTASVTVIGGTPNYTYLWSNGGTGNSISGVGAGTYSVAVTDSNGCLDSTSVTVTEPTAISNSFTQNEPDCNGSATGSVMASPAGGTGSSYQYNWNTGATTGTLSNVTAGTYSVVITDSNGCTYNDTTILSEPTALVVSTTVSDPNCNGDSTGMIAANVSGGTPSYLYAWSTGAFTDSITGLPAGAYAVTVTDTNGCQAGDTIMLTSPPAVTSTISATDISCNGQVDGTATAMGGGGTPGYTYLWSNGDTSGVASGLGAGTYSVVITDANGCWTSDTTSIAEPTAITGSGTVVDEINGNGNGSIDFTAAGGTPPYTYSWSNGATTEDLSGISSGTYTVTVTDGNGCTYVDTFVVDMIVGIAPGNQGPQVSLYPNPAENEINIRLEGAVGEISLEIVSMDGRVLNSVRSEGNPVRTAQIRVAELPAGVYLLRISDGAHQAFVRWTKQ